MDFIMGKLAFKT